MPADAFTDLDTLAALGDGTLWRRGPHWTYANAPTNSPLTSNITSPLNRVADSRVQASLQAGAWIASWVDNTTGVPTVLAVVKAPADGSLVRPRGPADFGAAA